MVKAERITITEKVMTEVEKPAVRLELDTEAAWYLRALVGAIGFGTAIKTASGSIAADRVAAKYKDESDNTAVSKLHDAFVSAIEKALR